MVRKVIRTKRELASAAGRRQKPTLPERRPLLALPPHPSGRPIKRDLYILRSRPQPPWDGPVTPGLRRLGRTEAIGFHHSFSEVETWEDEEEDLRVTRGKKPGGRSE